MGTWHDVDDKLKKRVDREFVSCTEEYERRHVIDSFMECMPDKSCQEVESAFERACQSVGGNHPRRKFVETMHDLLS